MDESSLDEKKEKIKRGPILVTAAIIQSGSKYLITRRRKDEAFGGYWEFPGGKVEYRENPQDCLVREIKEELDCNIKIESLYDVSSIVYPNGEHYIILFFRCILISGEPKSNKHEEIRWIPLKSITDYEFLAGDKRIIKKLTAARAL